MRIAVVKELRSDETRVAMVPELVGKLTALGHEVVVEAGAGTAALHADEEYAAAGAAVSEDPYADAELVCSVQPPVQEVLDISGFTALLTIRAGREDALGELAS